MVFLRVFQQIATHHFGKTKDGLVYHYVGATADDILADVALLGLVTRHEELSEDDVRALRSRNLDEAIAAVSNGAKKSALLLGGPPW